MAKDKRDREKRGQDLVDENMELLGSLKIIEELGPGGRSVSQRHKALPKIQINSNWKMLLRQLNEFLYDG